MDTVKELARWWLLGLAVAGCGGEDKPIPPLWVGPSAHSTPTEFADVYLVKTSADGSRPAWTILDTGAPFSLLNARAFDRGVSAGSREVGALSLGGITLWRVPVLAVEGTTTNLSEGLALGGILGYSAFRPLRLTFDPLTRTVGVGDVPLPQGVDVAGVSAPIVLRGGGTVSAGSTRFEYLPSRIVLDVEVEGRALRMLFDTGASSVLLTSDVFSPIIADGRPTVESDVSTTSGTGTATVARLRSMTVLGQTVTDIVAVSTSVIAPNLRAIEDELGEPIQGLIGHSFFREFVTVVDYPGARVSLHRCANRDHVLDDYRRVGFTMRPQGTRLVVDRIYAGTAAALALSSGQEVLAIDGQPVAALGLARAELALRGVVGTTREIQFDSATLVLPVEELLPTP
jgi:hypothetical protein